MIDDVTNLYTGPITPLQGRSKQTKSLPNDHMEFAKPRQLPRRIVRFELERSITVDLLDRPVNQDRDTWLPSVLPENLGASKQGGQIFTGFVLEES